MVKEYDVVIVGSGIGGATVANELLKNNDLKILLLEKGGNHQFLGNHLAIIRIADKKGFRYTTNHNLVASGITLGGSSVISAGTAFRPPPDFFKQWGISLEQELDEAEKETRTTVLPDELIGSGNLNLLNAGNDLGYKWEKLPKFIDPTKCIPNCSACMFGCKREAKFTARDLIKEAQSKGLEVEKKKIESIISNNNTAIGVKPKRGHVINSKKIIIAAGGLHSSLLLQQSGIQEAGRSFFFDPLICTYGVVSEKSHCTINNVPMAVGTYKFYEKGFMQSPLVDSWGLFLLSFLYQKNLRTLLMTRKFRHYKRFTAIMTKIQDERSGFINKNRFSIKISKPLTDQDYQRLNQGHEIAKEVLIAAGAKKNHIFSSPIRGAHPGGSNSIGKVVDMNLETVTYKNLFVCDSSILPRSMGTPLILTIMAFAKRLAHFLGNEF
ncbi:MAG: GMC family oxidoreductase N-terminal domain-containing protein [Candidatus Hodarchaeota archaeon]